MRRLTLSAETRQNMPALNFETNPAAPGLNRPACTQPKVTHPKIWENPNFPGVMLRKVSSFYEILGECNGLIFTVDDPSYNNRPVQIMLVGDAVEMYLKHGIDHARYGSGVMVPGFPNIAEAVISEARSDFRWIKPGNPPSYTGIYLAPPLTSLSNGGVVLKNVMGVISDADWGYGIRYHNGGAHADNGMYPGMTLIKYAELGSLARIFSERKQEIFLAEAGEAAEYMSRAVDEFCARDDAKVVLKAPLTYTRFSTLLWSGVTDGRPGATAEVIERFGIPAPFPVSQIGPSGAESDPSAWYNRGYLPVPIAGRLPKVYMGPVFGLADAPGSSMLEDVLLGMLLWRHTRADQLGPGDPTPVSAGLPLADAIALALKGWNQVSPDVMATGFSGIGPVRDVDGNITSIGSFSSVADIPQLVLDMLRGPVGIQNYDAALKASKWICGRAEAICKAEN